MSVRPARAADRNCVLAMMARLWPGESALEFEPETLFVWEGEDGLLGGFAEVSIRPYVDGCETGPCPHVEAWWVEPPLRRSGIGRALIAAIEHWARGQGYAELGSDALLDNRLSHRAHEAIGFAKTEQVQYFRKRL
jgi:aminoglycoside 6'-N-acetyltransferase I